MPTIAANHHSGLTLKKKEKKNVKGSLLALGAGTLANLSSLPVSLIAQKGLTSYSKNLSANEIKATNEGAQRVLKEITNLFKKGVRIEHTDVKDCVNGNLLEKILFSNINQAAKGENAFYVSAGNMIVVNKDKLPLAQFHELGHAFNFNNSNFWKQMQKMRMPAMGIASLFILIPALTKNHEAKEGEELTKGQKFVNGLRKACPFLASASMLPMLLEEGKATLRGNNWAKEVFKNTPDLAKKVAKTNKWGFVAYTAGAQAAGFAAWVALKVKDNSDKKMALNNIENSNITKALRKQEHHQG